MHNNQFCLNHSWSDSGVNILLQIYQLRKKCFLNNSFLWNQVICSNLLIGVLCSLRHFRKAIYKTPTHGSLELAKKISRDSGCDTSPSLADNHKLCGLPLTYVITCQYYVLRDYGHMYVTRLWNSGVRVVHNHIEGTFHGTLSFLLLKLVIVQSISILAGYMKICSKNLINIKKYKPQCCRKSLQRIHIKNVYFKDQSS